MNKPIPRTQKMKTLFTTIASGSALSLLTGFLKNSPEFSIIEAIHYGYPLVWRITKIFQSTEIIYLNLLLDVAFWTPISFLALMIIKKARAKRHTPQRSEDNSANSKHKTLLLFSTLFLPLGFVMDLIHELGHALWGTTVGGTLTYMKIAFFQVYPSFAMTPEFVLGYTKVDGISSSFARGVFLLGGSLTTQIASWITALILIKASLGHNARVALWTLGLFGLLDLPFYISLPQMGLQHWIFLGGGYAEPLIGARLMGVPDPLFYLIVGFTTLTLAFLHINTLKSMVNTTQKSEKYRNEEIIYGGKMEDVDTCIRMKVEVKETFAEEIKHLISCMMNKKKPITSGEKERKTLAGDMRGLRIVK